MRPNPHRAACKRGERRSPRGRSRAATRAKPKPEPVFLLTCEHGGNRVPREYAALFRGAGAVLRTHRGFDAGALSLARALARRLGAPLHAVETTRLLVDPNRSPDNPAVFSQWTRALPARERRVLLACHHAPHRRRVEQAIRALGRGGVPVVHVAVHSFTPRFRSRVRTTDIGLLYDPRRRFERELAGRWQKELRAVLPGWRIRRNDPYRGTSDGLTTVLRRRFPDAAYAGIELEVNQRRLKRGTLVTLFHSVAEALETLASWRPRSPGRFRHRTGE